MDIAIVIAAQRALLNKYPGIEFHFIYWDNGTDQDKTIENQLQQKGIKVHLISDILPDIHKRRLNYAISEFDHHPNLKANKCIAHYIIRNILHESDRSADLKVPQVASGTNH